MELSSETLEQHWLPFTDNREFKREPRLFVRASGMYYWSQHGRKILAHPAACAAGLATLKIYEAERLFARGRELSPYFHGACVHRQSCRDRPDDRHTAGCAVGILDRSDDVPGRDRDGGYSSSYR